MGEILHRNSLRSQQKIQPGQVNLMTAEKGISHSEESLPDAFMVYNSGLHCLKSRKMGQQAFYFPLLFKTWAQINIMF